jgi:hypothetical protein
MAVSESVQSETYLPRKHPYFKPLRGGFLLVKITLLCFGLIIFLKKMRDFKGY